MLSGNGPTIAIKCLRDRERKKEGKSQERGWTSNKHPSGRSDEFIVRRNRMQLHGDNCQAVELPGFLGGEGGHEIAAMRLHNVKGGLTGATCLFLSIHLHIIMLWSNLLVLSVLSSFCFSPPLAETSLRSLQTAVL